MKYNIRDIIALPESEIWGRHDGVVTVMFDDGEVDMTWRQVEISQYLWDMHRDIPELPLYSDFAITNKLGIFKTDTYNDILTKIVKVITEKFPDIDKDYIMKKCIYIINRFHNGALANTQEYTTTISCLDFLEIMESDEFNTITENIQPNHPSINKAYAETSKLLRSKTWKPHNQIHREVISGNVNEHQVLQIITARGKTMEVDGVEFNKPITRGFGKGLHDIHDVAVESRSASMALVQTTDPIADTEYFNRRLSLLNKTIRYVYVGDCGSKNYQRLVVDDNNTDAIIGLYYLDEDSDGLPQEVAITKEIARNLLGKRIKLRFPTNCNHKHKYGICEKCLGGYSRITPRNTSLGQASSIVFCEKSSQTILGTKHLLRSIMIESFKLAQEDMEWLEVSGEEGNLISLNQGLDLDKYGIKLTFDASVMTHIKDITVVEKLEQINFSKLTKVKEVMITPYNKENPDEYTQGHVAKVSGVARDAFLTPEFLQYVDKRGYELKYRNKYVEINLDEWDKTIPIFQLPMKRPMMGEFLKNFADMIESDIAKYKLDINTEEGMEQALDITYRILTEFIQVPLVYLGVLLTSIMVRDETEGDYRLPLPNGPREFGSAKKIFSMRSLACAMAYEEHVKLFKNIGLLTTKLRTNHPFDAIVVPGAFDVWQDVKGGEDPNPEIN